MKIINIFFLIVILGIVACASFFWIGSYEQKIKLGSEVPFSFILCFLAVSTIGLVGVAFLLVFNYPNATFYLKKVDVLHFKKVAVRGCQYFL